MFAMSDAVLMSLIAAISALATAVFGGAMSYAMAKLATNKVDAKVAIVEKKTDLVVNKLDEAMVVRKQIAKVDEKVEKVDAKVEDIAQVLNVPEKESIHQ